MKKVIILLMTLLAVTMVMAACDGESTEIEAFGSKYQKIEDATSIEQTIEIKGGKLTKYSSVKTLTKNNDGYAVSETTKRLSELGDPNADENGFVTETNEYSVTKSDEVVCGISLNKDDYEKFELTDSGLTATAKNDKIKEVLGVASLDADISELSLTVTTDEQKVTAITIDCKSGEETISISVKFNY